MSFFGGITFSATPLKCVSINNQEYKVRSKIINEPNEPNSNEPLFYPDSVKIDKCSGSCNNINDPHAKLCVPHVTKNINV